jgi:hypothetical protein
MCCPAIVLPEILFSIKTFTGCCTFAILYFLYYFTSCYPVKSPHNDADATACVSGLFLIAADFSSDNCRAVAHLSLENPLGTQMCTAIATMFMSHPSSRRIGFEGQYAYVLGSVAFSIKFPANAPYFDIREASINPMTSYIPSLSDDEVSKFIDDSTHPPVIHGFRAYTLAFATFHIAGTITTVHGEGGSENFHFILQTQCYNCDVC